MKIFGPKFYGILTVLVFGCINLFGQTTIEDLNFQLRDVFKKLKKAPDQTPFLYDMSSHILDNSFYTDYNDTSILSTGMFYTMYEEMRSSAYDTTILDPSDSIINRIKESSKNDTVFMSILDADYATFMDTAFINEGEYFYLNEDSVTDVVNRPNEPFNIRNTFISTINVPTSYFRKVVYVLDTNYIFARNNLFATSYSYVDLNPTYASWRVDFGDGVGWRTFDPKTRNVYEVTYPDTGAYYISTAIFYCDPFPLCSSTPSKLSKTAIYILNNSLPQEPDLTYEFANITVGLYKACGEVVGGVYIPKKPIIIIEGIDILNSTTIPKIYDDYVVQSSKRLNDLIGIGYDFYIVNFNDTKIDMRDNARGVIELLNYLKSIMTTNEQFVVIGESMGGVIARYALTYMETNTYKNEPNVSKPDQLHNTRLLITNDSPHQGAYVPIAYQMLYRNVTNSLIVKVLRKAKNIFPVFDDLDEMSRLLDSKAIQQLLAHHIDASGLQHGERDIFMDELINMNTLTNGYPKYCKLLAMTDGLLTGQHQLKTNNTILSPGEKMFNLNIIARVRVFRDIKVDLVNYNLDLYAVDKNNLAKHLLKVTNNTVAIHIKGCLRKLLRLNVTGFISCAVASISGTPLNVASNVIENYETTPGGMFSAYTLISKDFSPKDIDLLFFTGKFNIDKLNGNFRFVATTSDWKPSYYVITPEIEINMSMPYFNFGFIPVQSAIDIDYYKSQNFAHDENFLIGDVQSSLLAYSPFHVISGFENFTVNYPTGVDEKLGNCNWSHGFFNNHVITKATGIGYLSREIGDDTLYVNNLDLGERNADFTFRNVYLGVDNPNYKYHYASPILPDPELNGTYSKDLPFRFKEPGEVSVFYHVEFIEGSNAILEGTISQEQITIEDCRPARPYINNASLTDSVLFNKNELNSIVVYPNPFDKSIILLNLNNNETYNVSIYNTLGQLLIKYHIENIENNSNIINTEHLDTNSIYTISIENSNGVAIKKKLVKFK